MARGEVEEDEDVVGEEADVAVVVVVVVVVVDDGMTLRSYIRDVEVPRESIHKGGYS